MKKRVALFVFWVALFTLVPAKPALAYIDPATTTYIIQVVTALIITLGVSLSIFLYRFQMVVTNIRVYLHALMRRFDRPKDSVAAESTLSHGTQDVSLVQLTEEEALATGVIDYAIPVCENYTALAPSALDITVAEEKEVTMDKAAGIGRLRHFGHWLWDDKRTIKKRLLVSALIGGGLSMTYMVFPMIDTMIANQAEIPFFLGDVMGLILLFGLIAFTVLTLFLSVLRGRLFNLAICVALSFLVCGYLQITFFNSNIGQLMGTPMGWEELGIKNVIVNLLIWITIFTVTLVFGLFGKVRRQRFFKQVSRFIPALIIVVQLIALFAILPPAQIGHPAPPRGPEHESGKLYLTWDGVREISANENVLVFVLDMLDESYISSILEEDPHFFDSLDGFTYFPNNVTEWNSTYPSVISYMTGAPYDPSMPRSVYTEEAYRKGSFVGDIRKLGYSANVYMEGPHCYSDGAQLKGVADNLHPVRYTIDSTTAVKQLIKLNLLKVTPHAFKFRFWVYSDIFDYAIVPSGPRETWIYKVDDLSFYEDINKGLQKKDGPGHFSYYHLNGPHAPWVMNAQAQYAKDGIDPIEQAKGCFVILNEYFRQMRELDIYKEATIIITGDHPIHDMHKLLDRAAAVALFIKPSGSDGTPLQINNAPVSIDNLGATCIQAAGGNPGRWGKTYFEVDENAVVERYYHHRYTDDKGIHYTAVFRITGDARDWNNWELVEQIVQDDKYWF